MNDTLFHRIEGKGPPLVLLHPVGLDHTFWGPLPRRAGETHTVISVDLRGHGRSPAADAERGIAAYAGDIAHLLDELDLGHAAVLGLSFGGMIAQEFALRNPGRVSLLAVGACGPRIDPANSQAVRLRGKVDAETGMAGVVGTTIDRWFTPPFRQTAPVESVRERLLANDPQGWAAGWNAIAGFDALDRLASVRVPTLVMAGELDAGTPVAATRAIADAIPGSQFTIFPGAPHMMQIEGADRFADRVTAFLRGQGK